MTGLNRFAALWVLAAGLGCGVPGEDPRAQLVVKSASWLDAASSSTFALAGPANLAITLRVSNAQATPLSLGGTHFVLSTSDGYLYRASPGTNFFPGGCNAGASVAAGASVDCTVLFSVSGRSLVSQVGYEFDDKATSVVRIAVNACTFCGSQCVDLATDSDHCGACNQQVAGKCQSGKPTCSTGLTACGAACVNLLTDPDNCGACGRRVDGAQCVSGAPTCDVPEMLCGQSCTNVSADALNCGRCGAACPSSYACIGGQCSCAPGEQICGSGCVNTRESEQHCGACGRACASGQSCSNGTCVTSSGGGSGGGGGGGCSVNCSQFGLSCCGSSCC
jgi:Stigma-specific protein, Stig1